MCRYFCYLSADVVMPSNIILPTVYPVAWNPYLFLNKFLFPTPSIRRVVTRSMMVVVVMYLLMIMVAILDKWLPEFLPSKCLCCGCNR